MELRLSNTPHAMRAQANWVMWRTIERGGQKTKVPFQPNGRPAKSNDASTWSEFASVKWEFESGGAWSGVGYVFSEDDPFCGVDLDGCVNPETGKCADWAREIILWLNTYAELSPSQTGVKLYLVGKSIMEAGRKRSLDVERVVEKQPGIEIYDHLRFFAVTGWRMKGAPHDPQQRQTLLESLCEKYFPPDAPPDRTQSSRGATLGDLVIDRARKYMATMPGAVSGQGGHNQAFHVACILVLGFGLKQDEAISLIREWNAVCEPPWSDKELIHKVASAAKQPGERNYLRDADPQRWATVSIPKYEAPAPPKTSKAKEEKFTSVGEAAASYITQLEKGETKLIDLGIADVDYALGGGVEPGELVLIAARPSHGKSCVAMQCLYNAAAAGRPALMMSEEMSARALGKRAIQFAADLPEEHWHANISVVRSAVNLQFKGSAPLLIAEGRGTIQRVVETIRAAHEKYGVEVVAIDYAQLITSPGKSRYEQTTNTSVAIRHLTTELNITTLMLCQLNREIEKRERFIPKRSDLRDTGQLEQDADVLLFLVWPLCINPEHKPIDDYQVFIEKNRNRATNQRLVACRFLPSRQMVLPSRPARLLVRVDHDSQGHLGDF